MALAAPLFAQDPAPLNERTAQTDIPLDGARAAASIDQLDLSIAVNPDTKSISGRGLYQISTTSALEALVFDLDPRFAISRIAVGDSALPDGAWQSSDGLLTIALPETLRAGEATDVAIEYSGQPHEAVRAPWDGGIVWSQTPEGQPWIATAIQGEGCDMFWPCIDHSSKRMDQLDLRITVPAGLTAAGNGRLVETTQNSDGTTTFHWQARDPNNYGVTLQIAPYELASRDYASRYGNTIPLRFWHLPGNEEGADRLLDELADQIVFMEETFGPYPFADEKAGVAETPHLGMEHQTINAYGNSYRPEAYGHDWLLQHEFAHEWFANQLTHASINHMWLHEGITTWTQPLYLEWARGRMFYEAEMWRQRQRVWSRVPLVPPDGELPDYGDREARWGDDIYHKGSWIMHTLRYLVGDKVLFPAVTELTYGASDPQPGDMSPVSRTTDDFRLILENRTGREFDWFFDTYFYHADLPRLNMSRSGDELTLEWETPSQLPFAMPVELSFDGTYRRVPMRTGRNTITLPPGTGRVQVDPHNRILRYDADVEAWQNRPQD